MTTHNPQRFPRKWIIAFGLLLIILALASVVYGVNRSQQLIKLNECANQAVVESINAFRVRDALQVELNETNKRLVQARQHLFNILVRHIRDETVSLSELNQAEIDYMDAVQSYADDLNRFTNSFRTAPVITEDQCTQS